MTDKNPAWREGTVDGKRLLNPLVESLQRLKESLEAEQARLQAAKMKATEDLAKLRHGGSDG